MAYLDQSFRGSDDTLCGDLRRNFPRYPRRPLLDGVVYGTDTKQLGDLAKFPQRIVVGHRVGSGPGDFARPRDHKDQEISLWIFRSWLARRESALASLRNGVST